MPTPFCGVGIGTYGGFMLIVRPIQNKDMQKELCRKAGISYEESAFAYVAALSDDIGDTLSTLLGVLQFDIGKDGAKLLATAKMPDTDDTEAMIIMCRAAMDFMHRSLGINLLTNASEETDKKLLEEFGFVNKDGEYQIDLELFYKSPCGYKAMMQEKKQ